MSNPDQESEDAATKVISDYLAAIDEGKSIDRQEYLETHREHSKELQAFFDDLDAVHTCLARNPADDTASDNVPKQLGRFKLESFLGSGSYGAVWKADDTSLDRDVAIKLPAAGLFQGDSKPRFLREAKASAGLRHPNIVRVHEVGEENGTVYIVSDFIEGVTLQEWIDEQEVTPTDAAKIALALTNAMDHAHDHGVIHRDIKPTNVLMDSSGKPHLTDFGLAKRDGGDETLTLEGQVIGTPAYMSPEQARGEGHSADARSDIYSIGTVLYHLLTGDKPFRGRSQAIIRQVLHEEPTRPRTLATRVPKDLETVCLKCMEKEPPKRYQRAEEVGQELERWLSGKPIQARPLSRLSRATRWCYRNRAISSLIGVTVASAILIIGILAKSNIDIRRMSNDRAQALKEKETALHAAQAERDIAQSWWKGHSLAQAAVHVKDRPNRARSALEQLPEEARGFAWNLLSDRVQPLLQEWQAEEIYIEHIAYSPDSSQLISAGDHAIRVWDIESQQLVHEYPLPGQSLTFALSPDGKLLAGAGGDGKVSLWNNTAGTLVGQLPGHRGPAHHVAFHPTASQMATSDADGTIRVWNLTKQEVMQEWENPHSSWIAKISYSNEGDILYSIGNDGTLCASSVKTGKLIKKQQPCKHGLCELVISPQGQLATTGYDWTMRLWEPEGLEVAWEKYLFEEQPLRLAFDVTGKKLLSHGCDGAVRIRDTKSGDLLRSIAAHFGGGPVVCSPDGKRIASSAVPVGIVREWPCEAKEATFVVESDSPLNCATWHDSLSLVVAGGDEGYLVTFDPVANKKKIQQIDAVGKISSIAFSPQGDQLYVAGAEAIASCELEGSQWKVTEGIPCENAVCIDVSSDSKTLVVGDKSGHLSFYDSDSLERIARVYDQTAESFDATYSNDGHWLASCGAWTHQHGDTGSCFLRKDGLIENKTRVSGHHNAEYAVAFSADSSLFASSAGDRRILLRHPGKDKILKDLVGHERAVVAIDFSPDGKLLASADFNNTSAEASLFLWDVETGLKVAEVIECDARMGSVVWSPDGTMLAAPCQDGKLRIWKYATQFIQEETSKNKLLVRQSGDAEKPPLKRNVPRPSVASLWELLQRGDYEKTISMADKLLDDSYETALAREEELQQGEIYFPNGEVPEEDRWKIDANVSLNEVAIGLFIKGQAAELNGDCSLAEKSYLQAEDLPHARCWDPNGWYWSPAVAAADHRRKMKLQETLLPANVEEIRDLNKKVEALKTSGLTLAKQKKWKEAAAAYQAAYEHDATFTAYCMYAGPLLLLAEDSEGYQQLIGQLHSEYADTTDPVLADRLCKLSSLTPWPSETPPLPTKAMEDALEGSKYPSHVKHWWETTLALVALRADDFENARRWSDLSRQGKHTPSLQVLVDEVRALVLHSQGESKEAKLLHSSASETIIKNLKLADGNVARDWLIAEVLRREAERALGSVENSSGK